MNPRASDLVPAKPKEAAMPQKEISQQDKKCISQCILDHWSEHSRTHPDQRQEAYTQCLSDCRVCA